MDEKRTSGRSKKPAKQADEGAWDCSVCTFKNSAEAYKCEMCDVRKGTSTRKPKINPQIVAQQVAQQFAAPLTPPPGSPVPDEDSIGFEPVTSGINDRTNDRLGPPPPPKLTQKKEGSKKDRPKTTPKSERVLNTQQKKKLSVTTKLSNVDRSSAQHMSVTVDNVTVVITDYQPKKRKISVETSRNSVQSDASDSSSNASNDIHDESETHHTRENHT